MTTIEENNTEEFNQVNASKKLKKRGFPFWVVFLISGWMFFLGVMVGRGTSPINFDIEALNKKIAELKQSALLDEEMKIQDTVPVSPGSKSELEFYEALKMREQPDPLDMIGLASKSPDKSHPDGKTDIPATPEIPMKTKSVSKTDKTPVLKEPALKEPALKEPALKEPALKEKDTKSVSYFAESGSTTPKADRNYSIQVASLKDPQEADRMVEIYRKKGYPAYRASAEVRDSGTWYRVRIGPFSTQSEALRILGPVSKESKGALILEHSP